MHKSLLRAMLPILTCLAVAPAVSGESFMRQYAETFRFRLGHPASVQMRGALEASGSPWATRTWANGAGTRAASANVASK